MPKLPYRLILASRSPRRSELLREAGYEFEVLPARDEAEGGRFAWETPPEYVARMALQKAADVVERLKSQGVDGPAVVVGCDTVAECRGEVLGKPVDEQHAGEILRKLSGREHHVFSGLCVWRLGDEHPQVEVAATRLQMHKLSESQLSEYLASGLWEGKAGAFGYQDRLGWLSVVDGSESNVVGLPMELLARMLEELDRDDSAQQQQQ